MNVFPICHSCREPLGNKYRKFIVRHDEIKKLPLETRKLEMLALFEEFGIDNICCRQTLVTTIDPMEIINKGKKLSSL